MRIPYINYDLHIGKSLTGGPLIYSNEIVLHFQEVFTVRAGFKVTSLGLYLSNACAMELT